MCLQMAGAPSCCCAPTEREPNSVTSGYKHLAPAGAKADRLVRVPVAGCCCARRQGMRVDASDLVTEGRRRRNEGYPAGDDVSALRSEARRRCRGRPDTATRAALFRVERSLGTVPVPLR